ncbi:MAG: type IVB secretion system coupling complex protein DotM/IcmP, partial [Legionellaceae bacterium]|nr:type IVB secretion system coupling complex protein DotM/IcmP [Legionellaceae bacterium]
LDSNTPGIEMTAGLKDSEAKQLFTLQLGAFWNGFEHIPPYAWALAAVFMARLNRDRSGAEKIISTLNITFTKGRPEYAVAKATLKKHMNAENVQEILQRHAYMLTVMASLLEGAREDGVMASADFLWLKVVDRRLWYMLNSVGRQTPYVEVGGPFSHWKAEKKMGRKIIVPMVSEAVKALSVALSEVKLTPKELAQLEP